MKNDYDACVDSVKSLNCSDSQKRSKNSEEGEKKLEQRKLNKFYLASKGNQFKNKTVLLEAIHKSKQEKIKITKLEQ